MLLKTILTSTLPRSIRSSMPGKNILPRFSNRNLISSKRRCKLRSRRGSRRESSLTMRLTRLLSTKCSKSIMNLGVLDKKRWRQRLSMTSICLKRLLESSTTSIWKGLRMRTLTSLFLFWPRSSISWPILPGSQSVMKMANKSKWTSTEKPWRLWSKKTLAQTEKSQLGYRQWRQFSI